MVYHLRKVVTQANNQMMLSAIEDIMVNNNGVAHYELPTTLIKYEENGVTDISTDQSILRDASYTILDTLPILSPSQSISLINRDGVVVQKRLYELLTPHSDKLDYSYFTNNVAPFGSSDGHIMLSLAGPGNGNGQYTVPPAPSFYIQDHLGNTRVKYDLICVDGEMEHRIQELHDYHPFGKTLRSYSLDERERYLFTGKERDSKINYDYFGARYYDSDVGRFLSVDPLADHPQNIGWSPYNYTMNNPINRIDPDGRNSESTHVDQDGKVIAVYNDGDNGVYQHGVNADGGTVTAFQLGKRYNKYGTSANGKKIGESLTSHSFMDSNNAGVVGATINLSDGSGQKFIDNEIIAANLNLIEYMPNATGGQSLDFKTRNINSRPKGMSRDQYVYRGMLFDGKIASARDLGNYAAGYVAGDNGLSWSTARMGFDGLESYQQGKFATEGNTTQFAQRAGHNRSYPIFQAKQQKRAMQRATNPWPTGSKF